jgi:hypothetical protein
MLLKQKQQQQEMRKFGLEVAWYQGQSNIVIFKINTLDSFKWTSGKPTDLLLDTKGILLTKNRTCAATKHVLLYLIIW